MATDVALNFDLFRPDYVVIDAQTLQFVPGAIRSDYYAFAIGTAGSSTLVLHTVLPALLFADGPSWAAVSDGRAASDARSTDIDSELKAAAERHHLDFSLGQISAF